MKGILLNKSLQITLVKEKIRFVKIVFNFFSITFMNLYIFVSARLLEILFILIPLLLGRKMPVSIDVWFGLYLIFYLPSKSDK